MKRRLLDNRRKNKDKKRPERKGYTSVLSMLRGLKAGKKLINAYKKWKKDQE